MRNELAGTCIGIVLLLLVVALLPLATLEIAKEYAALWRGLTSAPAARCDTPKPLVRPLLRVPS